VPEFRTPRKASPEGSPADFSGPDAREKTLHKPWAENAPSHVPQPPQPQPPSSASSHGRTHLLGCVCIGGLPAAPRR